MNVKEWVQQVIKPAEIEKYLVNGKDFIDEIVVSIVGSEVITVLKNGMY